MRCDMPLHASSRSAGARHPEYAVQLGLDHLVPARRQRGDPDRHRSGAPRSPDGVPCSCVNAIGSGTELPMHGTRHHGLQCRDPRRGRENLLAHAGAWISAGLVLAAALPAQTDWVRAPVLEPRSGAVMAYDAARERVVLFGGQGSIGLGDTWEWDGVSWAQQNPAASPTVRQDHAMAYDAARQRVVLFGGFSNGSGVRGDTW